MKADLSFIEQNVAFNASTSFTPAGDTSDDAQNLENVTVRCMIINAYLCPFDTNIPVGTVTVAPLPAKQVAYTNYPNNVGTYLGHNGGKPDGPYYSQDVRPGHHDGQHPGWHLEHRHLERVRPGHEHGFARHPRRGP